MPTSRPRSPDGETPGPAALELSLPEVVKLIRLRAGYQSHEALSDAARRFLPSWVPMNRRYVQQMEHGDLPREEINDLWLLAIARACGERPEVFGLRPGTLSEDIDPLVDLFVVAGWCRRP